MLSTLYRKPVFEFDRECLPVCFDIEYLCLIFFSISFYLITSRDATCAVSKG